MSIKIYEAYRVPLEKLNSFIDITRRQTLKATAKRLETYLKHHKIPDKIPDHIDKDDADAVEKWKKNKQFDTLLDFVRECEKNRLGDVYDLNSGLNIWIKDSHAYIIPIGCSGNSFLMKWKLPKWVEDFCYWNNTDWPEGMSKKEWNNRRKVWETINCGYGKSSHNARRMYHAFVDITNGVFTGTWELRDLIRRVK